MVSRTLPLGQLGTAFRKLGREMPGAMVASLRDAALELQGRMVQQQIAETTPQPVDQGQYKDSWGKKNVKGGAMVFNKAKHALWLEVGRPPGPIPFQAIFEWVKRKGLYQGASDPKGPRKRDSSGRFLKGDAKRDARIRAATFPIWKSLMKKGFKPRWILKKAIVRLRPVLNELGRKHLAELRP